MLPIILLFIGIVVFSATEDILERARNNRTLRMFKALSTMLLFACICGLGIYMPLLFGEKLLISFIVLLITVLLAFAINAILGHLEFIKDLKLKIERKFSK